MPEKYGEIRMSSKFGKGNAGKPKGAENKTTKAAKELFVSIMEGEVDHIKESLEKVRKKNPALYLMTLSKFYPYFMPKKLEVDTPTQITVHVKRRG
jgi:hypothetical protein